VDTIVDAAGLFLITRTEPRKFLLLRHHDRWDLPKGHVEPDESVLQAAIRETEEETGISREFIEVVPDFCYEIQYNVKTSKRGTYLKRVSYFLGIVTGLPEIRLTEHQSYRWFDWPATEPIQAQTIDPLISKLGAYFNKTKDA
jgi:bis(5'-nucleosidyl)-tetraphosphatase